MKTSHTIVSAGLIAALVSSPAVAETVQLHCDMRHVEQTQNNSSESSIGLWEIELDEQNNTVEILDGHMHQIGQGTRDIIGRATNVAFTDRTVTFCPVANECNIQIPAGYQSYEIPRTAELNRTTGALRFVIDFNYGGYPEIGSSTYIGTCNLAPERRF